jgi:hypothetical protein
MPVFSRLQLFCFKVSNFRCNAQIFRAHIHRKEVSEKYRLLLPFSGGKCGGNACGNTGETRALRREFPQNAWKIARSAGLEKALRARKTTLRARKTAPHAQEGFCRRHRARSESIERQANTDISSCVKNTQRR